MRILVQRVSQSGVTVGENEVGAIKSGLLVLLGVEEKDTQEDAANLANKLAKLRIMADKSGKMNLSVNDIGGKVLVVSQFTLYADTSKGNRPSFIKAANPEKAQKLYKIFVENLKKEGVEVETGQFGAYMEIRANLDGPVTIIMDS